MDAARWERRPDKILAAMHTLDDGSIVATKALRIYIPERFLEKKMAVIAKETYIMGVFGLVVDDKYYATNLTCAMMRVTPTVISTVKFGDVTYMELLFEPGETVLAQADLVKNDSLMYHLFTELCAKGHVPWYVGYDELATLFTSAKYHAGVDLDRHQVILEMIASNVARQPGDRSAYYRHLLKTQEDVDTIKPAYMGLRNVSYGPTNTTARLLGSYWNEGLTSALVNPSESTEKIEGLLRL